MSTAPRRLATARRVLPALVASGFAALALAVLLILPNDGIEDRARPGWSTYVPHRGHKTPHPSPSVLVVTSGHEIATGFAVGRDRIVTVAHALGDGEPIRVGGTRARIVRVDRRTDLALLAVPGVPGSAHAPVLAPSSARAGSLVRLLRLRDGRISVRSVHVRRAIVAHVRTAGGGRAVTRPALELAARVSPGDSGAPLVSGSGALAGVVFAASRERENTAYAVDASAVARLLAYPDRAM